MALRRFILLCSAALCFLLGTAARAEQTAGPDVGAYVSPQLGPAEAAVVRSLLNQLPSDVKSQIIRMSPFDVSVSIVDGATRTAHYNRPDLIGSLQLQPPRVLPGDDYPLTSGARPAGLCGQPFPGCYAGSGPYRRVYTPPVTPHVPTVLPDANGYFNTGIVTTACKAGNFRTDASHADVGNVYLGGWGTRPNDLGGTLDAGLQYNWGPKNLTHDDYSLYMNIAKFGYVTTFDGSLAQRLKCGGSVLLSFGAYPVSLSAGSFSCPPGANVFTTPACHSYWFMTSYYAPNHFGLVAWVAPAYSAGGWAELRSYPNCVISKHCIQALATVVSCGGCIFKWMTSIAQKNTPGTPYKEDLHDGSSYAAAWTDRRIVKWAYGGGGNLGTLPLTRATTLCSEYPLWQTTYDAARRDCENTPNPLTSAVRVSGFGWPGEMDAIDLR